jgi:hypothetical protein
MPDVTIEVRNAATGQKYVVELPDDAQMRELLPTLAEKLSIRDAGKLKLFNKVQQFEYNDSDTLAGRGTRNNDICLLSYDVIYGGKTNEQNKGTSLTGR